MTRPAGPVAPRPQPAWATAVGLVPAFLLAAPVSPLLRGELFDRVHTYALALDEHNTVLLENCLSEEVVWSLREAGERRLGPVCGRAAVVDALGRRWRADRGQTRHLFLNVMATDASDDRAVVQAYVLKTRTHEGVTRLSATGIYRFAIRRADEVWLMTRIDGGYDADLGQVAEGSGATSVPPGPGADAGPTGP